jgi:hypothetical protein
MATLGGKPSDAMPKYPVDIVQDIKAPVLGLYGGRTAAFR